MHQTKIIITTAVIIITIITAIINKFKSMKRVSMKLRDTLFLHKTIGGWA